MRKLFVAIMLVGVLGLFAIDAGTISVGGSAYLLNIGDLIDDEDDLSDDEMSYSINAKGGYFFMDNLELEMGLGYYGTTAEGVDAVFMFGIGPYYHMPFSETFGGYAGAMFAYNSGGDGYMYFPIDLGVELFITENNVVNIYNRFTFETEDYRYNSDEIRIGTTHYFTL